MAASPDRTSSTRNAGRRPGPPIVLPWIAILLHLALGLFPYAASGLFAPPYGVALLGVAWLGILVAAVVLFRRRPWWVVATPLVTVVVWFGIMALGDAVLGWTA